MKLRYLLGGAGVIVLGCASVPIIPMASLAHELRANQVGAYAKYRGKRLKVAGLVKQMGVQQVERVTATHEGGTWSHEKSTLHRQRVPYPFVELTDGPSADAKVICYFEPSQMEEVARLSVGRHVTLSGTFQEHVGDSYVRIVLNRCGVED